MVRVVFFGMDYYSSPYLRALDACKVANLVGVVIGRHRPVLSRVWRRMAGATSRRPGAGETAVPFEPLVHRMRVPVLYASDVNGQVCLRALGRLRPDVIIVAGFGQILKGDLLGIPTLAAVNFHPSLLPAYRGPMPTFWAIRRGEEITGVTAHLMNARIDDGPVLAAVRVRVEAGDVGTSLLVRLADRGSELVETVLEQFAAGKCPSGIAQDRRSGSYFARFGELDCEIRPDMTAKEAEATARACQTWRRAWCFHRGRHLWVHRVRPVDSASGGAIAEEMSGGVLLMQVADGIVALTVEP